MARLGENKTKNSRVHIYALLGVDAELVSGR